MGSHFYKFTFCKILLIVHGVVLGCLQQGLNRLSLKVNPLNAYELNQNIVVSLGKDINRHATSSGEPTSHSPASVLSQQNAYD